MRYPWNHPKRGWTFVRCGAYRGKTFESGVRIEGFHKDATDQMEREVREDDKHEIIDLKKLKIYSSYLVEMCEEAFEIDIDSLQVKPIFYRKDKYLRLEEGLDIFSVAHRIVHPEDRKKFTAVFSKEELSKIISKEKMVKVEFRVKTAYQKYVWVEAKIFYVDAGERKTLLFVTYDIDSKKRVSLLEKERDDILDAFLNLYKAIVEVDLHTKQVYVLKTLEEDQEEICRIEDMISVLFHRLTVESEKEEVRKLLDINYLKQLALEKNEKSLELRFQRANRPFQWIEMKLLYLPKFVVFLKDANNRGNVQQCASNLARKMQKTYIYEEKEVAVSASIGIALAPYEGNSFEELYEKADKALYAVKMDGKKGYSFYEDRKDWINV